MARFLTKIRKARFVVSPFSAQQMAGLGQVLADSIKARIQAGQTVYDSPAKPLSNKSKRFSKSQGKYVERRGGYAAFKRAYRQKHGMPVTAFDPMNPHAYGEIRDWTLTGRTMRSLKVLRASENQAVIGFTDAVANMRAAINNRRERQFGVSPTDQKKILRAIHQARFIRVKAA